jgi:hypothetical protein
MAKRAAVVLLASLALAGCGTVEAEDVELGTAPPGPCEKTRARLLIDDLGATYSDNPVEAAEVFARSLGGSVPTSGWVPYAREESEVLLASKDWRIKAGRDEDKGWLGLEVHRCG